MKTKTRYLLIALVLALTIYNILPTLFYYRHDLKAEMTAEEGMAAKEAILERLQDQNDLLLDWIGSYAKLLHTSPTSIKPLASSPAWVEIAFDKGEEAQKFLAHLGRAGSLIPFPGGQLSCASGGEKRVLVHRKIPPSLPSDAVEWVDKSSPHYAQIISDRVAETILSLTGESEEAMAIRSLDPKNPDRDTVLSLAAKAVEIDSLFGKEPKLFARLSSPFTRANLKDKKGQIQKLLRAFTQVKGEKDLSDEQLELLQKGSSVVKAHLKEFEGGQTPWGRDELMAALEGKTHLSLGARSPLLSELAIDTKGETLRLFLHPDFASYRNDPLFKQLLVDEISKVVRFAGENVVESEGSFLIPLSFVPGSKSALTIDLTKIAREEVRSLLSFLREEWQPKHPDFDPSLFPLVDARGFQALSPEKKKLCLVVLAPQSDKESGTFFLRKNSLYFVLRGIEPIRAKYKAHPEDTDRELFFSDLQRLYAFLKAAGFVPYAGSNALQQGDLSGDLILERSQLEGPLLLASRDGFKSVGSKRTALRECSTIEERLLADNRIDSQAHEDLQKWHDEAVAASIALDPALRFDAPPETKSLFWDNLRLSWKKYFRGDERKIIRWGLDLSGGKTVMIELRDPSGAVVKEEASIKQGMKELYQRVNRMGVSEVSIRQLGHRIALDFPGSQALSAQDLISASSMFFHIVNEQFSTENKALSDVTRKFLQEVWNEALVEQRCQPEEINEIARRHLTGGKMGEAVTESAKILRAAGLQIAPAHHKPESRFDTAYSKIALLKGNDPLEWRGEAHPLLIVFHNIALEGSSLGAIKTGSDPQKGNFLAFDVKKEGDLLRSWTSLFAQDVVHKTPYASFSQGRGWRMAVILNDRVITSPTLNDQEISRGATITGKFSQREVNLLAADLKAGSLSFTPHILSEHNVSPELGAQERNQGIMATLFALFLVVCAMVAYYRFGGAIASLAVFFNLLIMWAILQNLGAILTLPGIAGIILTVGMAVDANVLVFERMREEFDRVGRIIPAVEAGYKKAFSAIFDSNLTTILAALILFQFDAGPIKGLAITLIVGIASSMFTALFMTRTYFTFWAASHPKKKLSMANWIKIPSFDFLKKGSLALAISLAIIFGGGVFLLSQGSKVLGLQFTGGYAVELTLQKRGAEASPMAQLAIALEAQGVLPTEYQLRELASPHHLRLFLSSKLDERGKLFGDLSAADAKGRWLKVLHAMQQGGVELSSRSIADWEKNFTSSSGEMSETMRNQSIIALLVAFVAIYLYLMIRFEFAFAISALLCLFHDVLITMGALGLLTLCGLPIEIDLNTIAALMTIIGYSLNDTIIIFDRIREERRNGSRSLTDLLNFAINATLSRTAITSGTTLLVVVALLFVGGSALFSFALVMTLGIIFGTLSSWFIAAPLLSYFLREKEVKAPQM